MSNMTPGPWYALGETVHPDRAGFDGLAVIAKTRTRRGLITKAQSEANAIAIAQLPTLIKAAEALLDALELHHPFPNPNIGVAAINLETALAKTKGETA